MSKGNFPCLMIYDKITVVCLLIICLEFKLKIVISQICLLIQNKNFVKENLLCYVGLWGNLSLRFLKILVQQDISIKKNLLLHIFDKCCLLNLVLQIDKHYILYLVRTIVL